MSGRPRFLPGEGAVWTVSIRYLPHTPTVMDVFQDRLDLLSVPLGLFVFVVGLGTLLGQPWQYAAGGTPQMVLQLLGALTAVAMGVGLVWLGHFVES
ncbi:MAG: hypothetical protein U5K70_01175 [Halodesulfurarchaeum sp.]|nr:hypothetical protein [Halodesulfurarchaeum sp.]